MAKNIILDVDTGSDDAVALMAAILSPEINLVAVCTVAGNKPIEKTTENTLRVVKAMNADVPVYRGSPKAIVKGLVGNRLPPTFRSHIVIDGKTMQMHEDYLDLPETNLKPEKIPAPMFYVDYLRSAKTPVTLVALGPLTNLAIAFMIDPTIVDSIEEIVIMGGACRQSNSTSSAEFNIFSDPEAALWVLQSGAEITWVPLDATHAAYLTKSNCDDFRALGTVAGEFAASLIEQRIFMHTHMQPLAAPDSAAVHDALAVCYLLDPSVLKDIQHVHMDIGLSDFGEGQTIIDPRYYPEERNCRFAFSGDPNKFASLLLDIFKNGPKSFQKHH